MKVTAQEIKDDILLNLQEAGVDLEKLASLSEEDCKTFVDTFFEKAGPGLEKLSSVFGDMDDEEAFMNAFGGMEKAAVGFWGKLAPYAIWGTLFGASKGALAAAGNLGLALTKLYWGAKLLAPPALAIGGGYWLGRSKRFSKGDARAISRDAEIDALNAATEYMQTTRGTRQGRRDSGAQSSLNLDI